MIILYNKSNSAKILNSMNSLTEIEKNMVYMTTGELPQAIKILRYLVKKGHRVTIEQNDKVFLSVEG